MTTAAHASEIAQLLSRLAALMTSPPTTEPPKPRTPPSRVLLTVAEAAEYLNVGKTKMYELVMNDEVESVTIGRLRRIHRDALNAYAARIAGGTPRIAQEGQ